MKREVVQHRLKFGNGWGGATSGIGQETALGLARAGWHLTLMARSQERAEATLADIQRQVPGATGEIHQADLSSQAEIRRAAK